MGGRVSVHMPSTLRAAEPFRLLFAGQALSVVGDRITPVAIAFAVLAIGDATDLGIVLAASGIPFALFAIAGGVLSDRVGPRRTMIASDVIRTICQAAVAALLLTGTAEVWMLVVASALYGACAAIFMPALMGLIPQTVPPDRLQEANALIGFTRSVANVAGPAIAGVVIAACIAVYPPRREEVERAAREGRAFRQSPMPELARSAKLSVERAVSPNERMQELLHPWTSYVVVPIFALANAGVDLSSIRWGEAFSSGLTVGVIAGLVAGKFVGVVSFSWAAVRLGLGRLPTGIDWRHLMGAAWLAGIGFTMSLFIAQLAFVQPEQVEAAKVGILVASALAATVGIAWLWAPVRR